MALLSKVVARGSKENFLLRVQYSLIFIEKRRGKGGGGRRSRVRIRVRVDMEMKAFEIGKDMAGDR